MYSILQNAAYLLKRTWRLDPWTVVLYALQIPAMVLFPFVGIMMPKAVIDTLSSGPNAKRLLSVIAAYTLALIILNAAQTACQSAVIWRSLYVQMLCGNDVAMKVIDTDYENIESPAGQNLQQKAKNAYWASNIAPVYSFTDHGTKLIADACGLVLYGSVVAGLNPQLLLLLAASTGMRFIPFHFTQHFRLQKESEKAALDKKLYYLTGKSGDFQNGKDVRAYGMEKWFTDLSKFFLDQRISLHSQMENRDFWAKVAGELLTFLRDGLVYAYLIVRVTRNEISVSNFVLYFAAIAGFSNWLVSLTNGIVELRKNHIGVCHFRAYLDMPDRSNRKKGVELPSSAQLPCDIQFDHVSFRYPESDTEALKDFSLTINKGEKVAIVGRNGAGKTTAVKLLCGFYRPTSGKILLNGVEADKYNRDEYYTLFSAVFQDIKFMPVSLAQNVSSATRGKQDRVCIQQSIAMAGLTDKVESLPNGIDTLLVKSVDDNAVELSGGESQKLMLARALYKNADIIVLDEPTAALDPLAEHEMYMKYNEMTEGKTALYISHRLASTRFCDKIAFIENGCIEEYGSHAELMETGGKYAAMYEIQSRYYRDEPERKAGAMA